MTTRDVQPNTIEMLKGTLVQLGTVHVLGLWIIHFHFFSQQNEPAPKKLLAAEKHMINVLLLTLTNNNKNNNSINTYIMFLYNSTL